MDTNTKVILTLLVITGLIVYLAWPAIQRWRASRPAAPVPAPTPKAGVLSSLMNFRTAGQSLVVGAVVDFTAAFILMLIIGALTQVYIPFLAKIVVALLIGAVVFTWSTGFFLNKVELFNKAYVTYLGRIVPSGPNGDGLLPGYPYWLPFGYPIMLIAKEQDVREMTIPFKSMRVWAMNSSRDGQGAIEGTISGLAQFEIYDPATFNATENATGALQAIVDQSARDVAEHITIATLICEENEDLARQIDNKIVQTLLASNGGRPGRFGIRLKQVIVSETDNKDAEVKKGWSDITAQASYATSRATDAAGRIRRIRGYTAAGVEANRAAALDAVATTGHPGATVGDQHTKYDVGDSLKTVVEAAIARIFPRR